MSNAVSSYRLVVSVVITVLAAVLALSALQTSHHIIPARAAAATATATGSGSGTATNPDGTPWG